jgi:c-di-GMP-binding flagellar brake protein YcgR
MISLSNLILLQSGTQFWPEQNITSIIVGIALILIFVVVLLVGGFSARKGKKSAASRRKFNRYVFQRMAANVGLTKPQLESLENLIRVCKVKQPFLIFSNAGLLDDILKKGIYSVNHNKELSEGDKEKRLSDFYKIKETLERSSRRGVGITSTNLIRPGQSIVISLPDGSQLQTRIVTNLKRMLVCAIPDELGAERLAWKRGTEIKAHFWRSNDSGYVFTSKILGYDNVKGRPTFLIQHSRTLKRNQQRKFRRRPLARSCFFYPIEIVSVGKGRNAKRRAYVQENFKHIGNFLDISAGGCSVNSQAPLERGKLLMIQFEIERAERLTAYGKVRRVSSSKGLFSVMHIMFTKVTSRNLNNIYSYVYNYVQPKSMVPKQYRLTSSGKISSLG